MTDYSPETIGQVMTVLSESGFHQAAEYADWLMELTADLEIKGEIIGVVTAALAEEFSPDQKSRRDCLVGMITQIIWEA